MNPISNLAGFRGLLFACLAFLTAPAFPERADSVVLVSVKPLHSLVAGLMSGVASPRVIITSESSPHNHPLVPSIVSDLHKGGIVIYIDDRFEAFLSNRIFETLPERVLLIPVAAESGIDFLPLRTSNGWEPHSHSQDHENHGHESHGHENHGHEKSEPGKQPRDNQESKDDPPDLHVWLNPRNAIKIVLYLEQVLSAEHPEFREVYSANATSLVEKLDMLDRELDLELAGVRGKPYAVFHDAYQYFEQRYGLNAIGAIKLEPHQEASPGRIREIRAKLVQTEAKCVFREPGFPARAVSTVIEGTSAKSPEYAILDPLGTALPDGPDLYFELMRNLARKLKKCLD